MWDISTSDPEYSQLEIVKNTTKRILSRMKVMQWAYGSLVLKYINQMWPGFSGVLSLDLSINQMLTSSAKIFLIKTIKCVELYQILSTVGKM